ncbi:hypothetical protein hmeg3_09690 [Herbaspirillum sp. meg3]|nr:hypothetical protein hmeg3_09690 [Herbaspirillum sp. meg3]
MNIAALVVAVTVATIVFILVPEPAWNSTTIATAIAFVAAMGFVFYIPSVLRKQHKNTEGRVQLAAIGPTGAVSLLLLLVTAGAFALALANHPAWGLALLTFGIGAFVVASLMLNAALKVVGNVSVKSSAPSRHIEWQRQVSAMALQSTHQESLAKLRAVEENFLYLASDVPGGSPYDVDVDQTLNAVSDQLALDGANDLLGQLRKLDKLIAQRDIYLRSARSKI